MLKRRCAAAALTAAILGLALSGCGPGAGPSTADVAVTVTRDFGARTLAVIAAARVPGSETVMELLERHLSVGSRYGNDFVESIDGFSGTGAHHDWFYYVNGVQAPAGAGTTAVHEGDRIWWDLHDWSTTDSIAAVVGSYPEPFVDHGAVSRVTTVSCAADASAACGMVARALARAGVTVLRRMIGDATGTDRPTVLVGTERDLARLPAARLIAAGPQASGVYARFDDGGRGLELLTPRGSVAATLGAGAGLIAATALAGAGTPIWVISGTDQAGVAAAARALGPARLHDVFALALSGGRSLPLPLDPSA